MADYRPPLDDMGFVFRALGAEATLSALPGFADLTPELIDQVLAEAGRFAAGALAPLDRSGDLEGARIENGVVRTPSGFAEAYQAFVAAGWNGIAADPEYGGQGLPRRWRWPRPRCGTRRAWPSRSARSSPRARSSFSPPMGARPRRRVTSPSW